MFFGAAATPEDGAAVSEAAALAVVVLAEAEAAVAAQAEVFKRRAKR